jgi:hypothetical protein
MTAIKKTPKRNWSSINKENGIKSWNTNSVNTRRNIKVYRKNWLILTNNSTGNGRRKKQ